MEPIAALCKGPKTPKPAADGNGFDELPEALIHRIFSFLQIIDIVRASAVSRYWRYLWTTMPHLYLDPDAAEICPFTNYEKYKDFINWVLMSRHESVSIQSCRLTCSNTKDDKSVYRWLHILAKKRVQKLYLELCENENSFVLPYCLLASDSLEELEIELQYCDLKFPSCAGFSRLKSLNLTTIRVLDQNLFQNFISSCPLLQKLTLEECKFPGRKVVHISSRTLRNLAIQCDYWNSSDALSECYLKITCPNLVHFHLWGSLKSLSWGENPYFLQEASLGSHEEQEASLGSHKVLNDKFTNFSFEFLQRVCHVEILDLRINILKYFPPAIAQPGCFSTIFYNLKNLKLSTSVGDCMQSIIYLLKCTPNLQLLSVSIWHNKDLKRDYKCKMVDEDIECLTQHVKMVKLHDLDGCDAEHEVIRFFLKNAHVLEKMSIIWGSWLEQETERENIQKIMKFPSSSSHVNLTFLRKDRKLPRKLFVTD